MIVAQEYRKIKEMGETPEKRERRRDNLIAQGKSRKFKSDFTATMTKNLAESPGVSIPSAKVQAVGRSKS